MSAYGPASGLATDWLKLFTNGSPGSYSAWYAQLHTGYPGASGTSNVSTTTTRPTVAWGTASAGSVSASGSPCFQWTSWAGSSGEVDTALSLWSASTSGTFYDCLALGSSVTMYTGDTLQVTTLTISFTLAS